MQITRGEFLKSLIVLPFAGKGIIEEEKQREKETCPNCGSKNIAYKDEIEEKLLEEKSKKDSLMGTTHIGSCSITQARLSLDGVGTLNGCKDCGCVFGDEE